MNSVINRVIHQKKRLTINQPIKLWPLLLAIEAGKKATAIQATRNNMSKITLIVYPKKVMANM